MEAKRHVTDSTIVLLIVAATLVGKCRAQTVRVDTSHVVNTFSPVYALGTTVDRVPSNATDIFFRPDQLEQIAAAGWGVVSYRQNTELFVQAWHWNPKGTWSDPSGKATSPETRHPRRRSGIRMVIHSSTGASHETAEQSSTATRAWMMATSTPTGRAILTSPRSLRAKRIHCIHSGL